MHVDHYFTNIFMLTCSLTDMSAASFEGLHLERSLIGHAVWHVALVNCFSLIYHEPRQNQDRGTIIKIAYRSCRCAKAHDLSGRQLTNKKLVEAFTF